MANCQCLGCEECEGTLGECLRTGVITRTMGGGALVLCRECSSDLEVDDVEENEKLEDPEEEDGPDDPEDEDEAFDGVDPEDDD